MGWTYIAGIFVKHRRSIAQVLAVLVIVAAIGFAINYVLNLYFEKGKAASDKAWITKYNKDVKIKNDRIAELEKSSRAAAQRLEDTKDTAQKLVDGLYEKWMAEKTKGGPSSKVTVRCPSVVTPSVLSSSPTSLPSGLAADSLEIKLDTKDIILPEEYIKTWNEMNRKGRDAK